MFLFNSACSIENFKSLIKIILKKRKMYKILYAFKIVSAYNGAKKFSLHGVTTDDDYV